MFVSNHVHYPGLKYSGLRSFCKLCLSFKYKALSLHGFREMNSLSILIKRHIVCLSPIVYPARQVSVIYSGYKSGMSPIRYQERPISSITSKVEVNPTFFDTKPDLWRA